MNAATRDDLESLQMTPGEQATEAAARRLTEQIEDALAAVAVRGSADAGEIEAVSDRIERAARDLVAALRDLSQERHEAGAGEGV